MAKSYKKIDEISEEMVKTKQYMECKATKTVKFHSMKRNKQKEAKYKGLVKMDEDIIDKEITNKEAP
ncbi:18676_t:CDS:2 [Gigaspora margarita]|uniref:18676_t:CDS:1 n=1 Tax=Gigaspora margarita TaxID=4874 RepID=A0ABN7V7H1_GIGMA|nr:18676_t:CDS:2 [Gigaspora margarita]